MSRPKAGKKYSDYIKEAAERNPMLYGEYFRPARWRLSGKIEDDEKGENKFNKW